MDTLTGHITEVEPNEGFHVFIPFSDTYLLEKREINDVEVLLTDNRQLSPKQRNIIFALIADIAEYVNGIRRNEKRRAILNETLMEMQLSYLADTCDSEDIRHQLTFYYCQLCNIDWFSLADRTPQTVDMTTARDFIDWLVELCIRFGIPCSDSLINRCEDMQRYLYACVIYRSCAICGKRAEIHEYDRVGMGRNRSRIHHAGQRVQPLCRLHHREVDDIGQKAFDEKYHISWVTLDEAACEKLRWKK